MNQNEEFRSYFEWFGRFWVIIETFLTIFDECHNIFIDSACSVHHFNKIYVQCALIIKLMLMNVQKYIKVYHIYKLMITEKYVTAAYTQYSQNLKMRLFKGIYKYMKLFVVILKWYGAILGYLDSYGDILELFWSLCRILKVFQLFIKFENGIISVVPWFNHHTRDMSF